MDNQFVHQDFQNDLVIEEVNMLAARAVVQLDEAHLAKSLA